jgi:hypothetical protein
MSHLLDDRSYIKEEIQRLVDSFSPQEKIFFAKQIKQGETDVSTIISAINSKYRDEEDKASTFEDSENGLGDYFYVFQINFEQFLTSEDLKVQNDRKEFVRDIIHDSIQNEPESHKPKQ